MSRQLANTKNTQQLIFKANLVLMSCKIFIFYDILYKTIIGKNYKCFVLPLQYDCIYLNEDKIITYYSAVYFNFIRKN